jgi:hypothetical protein
MLLGNIILCALLKLLFEEKNNALRYIQDTFQSNFAHLCCKETAVSGSNPTPSWPTAKLCQYLGGLTPGMAQYCSLAFD